MQLPSFDSPGAVCRAGTTSYMVKPSSATTCSKGISLLCLSHSRASATGLFLFSGNLLVASGGALRKADLNGRAVDWASARDFGEPCWCRVTSPQEIFWQSYAVCFQPGRASNAAGKAPHPPDSWLLVLDLEAARSRSHPAPCSQRTEVGLFFHVWKTRCSQAL